MLTEGFWYEGICPKCNGSGKRWITKNSIHMNVSCYKCLGKGTIFVNWIENVFGTKEKVKR